MVVLLSLFHSDVYGSLWMLYRSIDAVQFHRLVTDVFDFVPQSFMDDYDVIATDFLYRSHCLLSLTDKDLTLTLFNTCLLYTSRCV